MGKHGELACLRLDRLLTIALFVRLGLYRAVTRFVSTRVLTAAAFGSLISAVLFCLTTLIFERKLHLALPIVYFLLLVVCITSSRMILRAILTDRHKKQMAPVIIYGAGQSGRQLLEAIKQVNEYSAVAFVDDNPKIRRTVIYDLTVYGPEDIQSLIDRYGVEKILLAIPSSTQEARRRIIQSLEKYKCEVLTIPGMKDLVDGKIKVSALKKSPSSIYSAATPSPPLRTHGCGHYRQNRNGNRCGRVHRLRTLPPNPEMPPVQIAAV